MAKGTIVRVVIDCGFGFIEPTGGGSDLFFHCSELSDELAFSEQLIERRVTFEETNGDRGPRAVGVRAAA